jgi:hypothetical protein
VEAVDWTGVDHQMVTLDALRIGAGRTQPPGQGGRR